MCRPIGRMQRSKLHLFATECRTARHTRRPAGLGARDTYYAKYDSSNFDN